MRSYCAIILAIRAQRAQNAHFPNPRLLLFTDDNKNESLFK